MRNLVLLSARCPGLPEGVFEFSGERFEIVLLPPGRNLVERVTAIEPAQREHVCAIVSLLTDTLGQQQMADLKSLAPQLVLLANYAVGYNNIDLAQAHKFGLMVTNTPHVLGDATADLTLTLMLMVSRRVWLGALEIYHSGSFPGWSPTYGLGMDLKGKVLGIVGLGDIGLRVAKRAQAFGMSVVALQSLREMPVSSEQSHDQGAEFPRIAEQEFLSSVDVLSLHCPLTPSTRGWLNSERIAALKPGTIVINTARGDLIDEFALSSALKSGHLYGAGLDVFCGEPMLSQVLRDAPHLVVLPHLGSATHETREAMGRVVLSNIQALVSGAKQLPHEVRSS